MESCNNVKDAYRSLYSLVKQLDDDKKNLVNVSSILDDDIQDKRTKLITLCKTLLFKDFQGIGKKSREILWRKGYYEFIAFAKKNWYKENMNGIQTSNQNRMENFLCEGIANYKQIASKMEEIYDLDLKFLIDFSIINDQDHKNVNAIDDFVVDKSLEAVSFALDTIHSALLSLGDLHRYFSEFKIESRSKLSRGLAAKYYNEAFTLNPVIGMAQNQLGTLFYGQNYDLDSIYHYLYSLVCIVPFELSENNVGKLLMAHADYLEKLEPNKIEFSLKDFYARFFLIIDIFFFDKEVPDFNNLCHCVLVDLRKILCSKNFNISEPSVFKIVSILFFCMSKLKMINSQKVYSLNAFLVAVCSDLIDSCIVNLEQYILANSQQNEKFQAQYLDKFNAYETDVRKSRDECKNWIETTNGGCYENEKRSRKHDDSDDKSPPSVDEIKTKEKNSNNGDEKNPQSSLKSSDEAKESDLKTPMSTKSKRKGMKLRRRRKKVAASDDESVCYDTHSELDTDFTSDEEDYSDLSSNFESDFSDIEDDLPKKDNIKSNSDSEDDAKANNYPTFSDNEDIVIEEEKIIYPGTQMSEEIDSEELIKDYEILNLNSEVLNFKSENEDVANINKLNDGEPPMKLKYKNKYTKIDPNIIIDFAKNEPTFRSLKILFDWLKINHEILFGCYHSNPEFIHKIMKLLNYCNIDIFTRKVFFEREFLKTENVRPNLCDLFDVRSTVPLSEDLSLKNFDLFQNSQIPIDWETTIREKITKNEETILRIFKIVEFGFFICKQKKFNYNFCVRSRKFTESLKKKREKKKSSRRRERRTAKYSRRRVEGRTRRYSDRKNGIVRKSYTSNEEKDTVEEGKRLPKKGYLRNRNQEKCEKLSSSGADEERSEAQKNNINKKCEIMGKLWLKNEVYTLEEELKRVPINVILTPFLLVDAKALTEYTSIVKDLVKSKKFIILIPNAVLNELDDLKKRSENARNVIRWLEQEFTHGNRHMRSQRDNENLTLSLLKIPRKLDREASTFLQIAQFCNHIVTNHSDPKCTDFKSNVITYLSGDNLYEKKYNNFSITGILDSIPAKHDQIANFYAKLKSNKK